MDKSWMYIEDRWSDKYSAGMKKFMDMARRHCRDAMIRCPCRSCRNVIYNKQNIVENHLRDKGMDVTYTVWHFHGEEMGGNRNEDDSSDENEDHDANLVRNDADEMQDIIEDIHRGTFTDQQANTFTNVESTHVYEDDLDKFERLFRDSKRKLYSGCKRYSVLLFIVKLMHIKVLTRWSNKGITMALELFKDALSDDNLLPSSYYAAKKLLSGIGMGYEAIHACPNDCVLFLKQYKGLDKCPFCSESRWKDNDVNGKRRPRKFARYFPIKPRLQRLFMSRKTASQMRWHKEGRVEEEGTLSHPADGEPWKHFDEKFPWFAKDSRNVRLGLSSDGFNPFNNLSSTYSMWPVVMVNYNMPPWMSKKEAYFMLSLPIQGPKSPGKEIDVYLQPLIEDLIDLFNNGIRTYDASTDQCFQMYATLMWTISDFPAYGDLSGWVTKGKMACPRCRDETSSISLKSKIGYIGHRRFLPASHSWRSMGSKFDGTTERRLKPRELSPDEILEQLEVVLEIQLGKNPNKKKRKRSKQELNWSKKSIFYELPYWKDHILPHNLDFMHLEKNWCDNLLATLLNTGKTKDTDKARDDLQKMGIRPELHLIREDDQIVEKPVANYTLSIEKGVDSLNSYNL
ncbi:hypothetical protein OROMI_009859 [Orobanche minor]